MQYNQWESIYFQRAQCISVGYARKKENGTRAEAKKNLKYVMFCGQIAWNDEPKLETSKNCSAFLEKYLAKRGWVKYWHIITHF